MKEKVIKGVVWTTIGYGASQIIRLGSNLILTRLLLPEHFGLSALVNSLMVGLALFSDVGIGSSIIQNKRGDEPYFLRTAWTIQIIRGFCLWLCACLLAYPFSYFYGEAQLAPLVMVAGFSAVIDGFKSTGFFLAVKHIRLKKRIIIEIVAQVATTIVMIVWAVIYPTVWALVVGALVGSMVRTTCSHWFLSTISHHLSLHRAAFVELVKFGRWIFISTMLSFFVNHADRLILGKFITVDMLGVFSIALMISKVVEQVLNKLNQQILFPLYSKSQESPIGEIRKEVKKNRLWLMSVFLPMLVILILIGPELIELLFDPRYQEAGWMLQVLTLGWLVVISSEIGPVYLAFGDSYTFMKISAYKALSLLVSMLVLGYYFGGVGVIWAISVSKLLYYPYQVIICRRLQLWFPFYDLAGMAISFSIVALGLYLKQ